MAQVLKITDGSIDADLLGIVNITNRGWSPGVVRSHTNLHERTTDRLRIKIDAGSDMDANAVEIIKLVKLLRKAWQFHNKEWQTTPVYWHVQGTNETNARFALVFNAVPPRGGFSEHDMANEAASILRGMVLNIEREAAWRDNIPGNYTSAVTLAASDGPATPELVHISNFVDENTLTHILNFDNSLTAFSADLIAETAFDYFAVDASTPATDDIVYFGSSDGPFHNVVINLGTKGVDGGSLAIIWEYYNGAWVTLTPGTNLGFFFRNDLDFWDETENTFDIRSIHVSDIPDWIAVAVSGLTAHWIRCRITAGTFSTNPAQATDVVYAQKTNHVEIPVAAIDGDLPPLLLQAFANIDGNNALTAPNFTTPSRIIVGARSRDLDNFQSSIPMADGVTTGFTQTLGTDASNVTTDTNGPGGTHVAVSFGTETLVQRVAQSLGLSLSDWFGTYRVFLRCEQVGGADGDLSVQVRTLQDIADAEGGISQTETVALLAQDAGAELVELGILNVPRIPTIDIDDQLSGILTIQVFASRSTGSSTLKIYDVILIPTDEWSATYNAPLDTTASIGSSLQGLSAIEVDAGVVRTRTLKTIIDDGEMPLTNNVPASGWELQGQYPIIEPSTKYRLYFIIMHYNGTFGTMPFIAPLGMALLFSLRIHNRYALLRGADA